MNKLGEKMTEKTLLKCNHVGIGYENKFVMRGLDFTIAQGDYICIIGENGSGKSTLIKTILGLLPIIEGEIIFDESIKNSSIGYLPQQTTAQKDFPASVMEIVLSGFLNACRNRPFYRASEKEEAVRNLELLGVSDLKKKCYRELSGGQQQRVLLARALCAAKSLLVLDEPVTGLDPDAAYELYENLQLLNREQKMTIIMVSHDVRNVVERVDKILQIEQNHYFFGSTEEYLETENGRKIKGGKH